MTGPTRARGERSSLGAGWSFGSCGARRAPTSRSPAARATFTDGAFVGAIRASTGRSGHHSAAYAVPAAAISRARPCPRAEGSSR
ncbi:hypothetical protein [Allobranchiibius sp. GilTou38]|uniref:hypothetical protein n=1 Tax=Allobranchiibius sp. GilTou38 TaxID=2815210 RepID=UPI001FB74687|nr:hypothetical protein [Allobranchiibius sp. GilTou38]